MLELVGGHSRSFLSVLGCVLFTPVLYPCGMSCVCLKQNLTLNRNDCVFPVPDRELQSENGDFCLRLRPQQSPWHTVVLDE